MRRRFLSTDQRPVRYMTVEPLENGVYLSFGGPGLYYSIDDSEWVSLPVDTNTPSINIGQTIKIKGLNVKTDSMNNHFSINGRCKLSGTIMSIIYGDKPYEEKIPFNSCFSSAFLNCASIVSVAPDFLPATTLADYCYEYMFSGCTSLTTAPELPATTLATSCYSQMFSSCSKLNYIKMLATDISASSCLYYWVSGVSTSGTFVKNPNMTSLPTGGSGIPSGWTVVNDGEEGSGDSLFPATLVPATFDIGNATNTKIANYFLENYPNMVVSTSGNYTPITEDITINGSFNCDGTVIGVAKWPATSEHISLLFYSQNSINKLYGFQVFIYDSYIESGTTQEYLFD